MNILVKKRQKIIYKLSVLFVEGDKTILELFLLKHRTFDFTIAIFLVCVLGFKSNMLIFDLKPAPHLPDGEFETPHHIPVFPQQPLGIMIQPDNLPYFKPSTILL